ncbi:MAG: hypothetical protein AB8B78_06570 [Polaribacter sp.]
MNEEMLFKYLEFLKKECLRHQNDKVITDDEINLLEVEIKSFIKKVDKSLLSEKIKLEISKIDFNLGEENHNHTKFKIFKFIAGFSSKEFKEQENRKQRFLKLYNDLDTLMFKIKSIL